MEYQSPFATYFDLVDLRLFVRTAQACSLTQGAESSFLSISAASLRIKNLEEAIGAKLLNRTKRGVSPTDAGQVFLTHARNVLAQIECLHGDMQPYARNVRGSVRVFANTTAITELLPAVLGQFLSTHQPITIDLQERLSAEIARAVHEGVAEVGVLAASERTDGLETLPYKKDRLVLAVPVEHPLADVPFIQFADTLEYDFVGLDRHSALHNFVQHELLSLGRGMRLRIQVSNFDAMCRMIEANVGIGILPEMAAKRHSRMTRIKVVQLLDVWAERELCICVRRLEELPIFARELIDCIVRS